MSRSDGMKVSGKMKIDLTIGSTWAYLLRQLPLSAEARSERRLTQATIAFFPILLSPNARPIDTVVFADTRFCSCNGSDQYKIAFLYLLFINQLFGYLCNVATVIFHFITRDSDYFRQPASLSSAQCCELFLCLISYRI